MSCEFNKTDCHRIWDEHPYSIWSGLNGSHIGDSLARHHVISRNRNHPERASMYNCALILNQTENISKHGELQSSDVIRLLLNKVKNHVDQTIDNGGYTKSELDKTFLFKYFEYYD